MKPLLNRTDLELLNHHKQILFACFCAEQVLHLVLPKDKAVCERAIKTAYLFVEGKATQEECRVAAAAAYAVYAAATYAAYAAAYATASTTYAANAATYAAYAAAYATASTTYAANAAAYAAADAAYAVAASTKDRAAIIEAQWVFYDQLLNGDKYFEEIVLREG